MKTVEETIAEAMDCTDISILPFLPYILQDFYGIGSSAELMLNIIKDNITNHSEISVIDLGCGKGAVSIKIAEELKCKCIGIDAISEFVEIAKNLAKEQKVNDKCTFITADMRKEIENVQKFDVIILGSIGPVFGDYYETIEILKKHLTQSGIIIMDDGYFEDESTYEHKLIIKRSALFEQIDNANMKIKKEYLDLDNDKSKDYEIELKNIAKRCLELGKKHPGEKMLFDDYIANQREEYLNLENKIICSTIVICHK